MPTAMSITAALNVLAAATMVVVQAWGAAAAPGSAVPLDTVLAAARTRGAVVSYWAEQADAEGRTYPASITVTTGRDDLRYTVMILPAA